MKRLFALFLILATLFLYACAPTATPPAGGDGPTDPPAGETPPPEDDPANDIPETPPTYGAEGIFAGSETSIPILRINTAGSAPIVSREEYLSAAVSMTGKWSFSGVSATVRGRGNSTWEYFEKKSYRLKFDKRYDLMGMGAAKDFVLNACPMDISLMQNYAALKLAVAIGSDYAPECGFVQLYVNGSYEGFYLLSERIEEDRERVDIGDGKSGAVDVGYLIEFGGNVDWRGKPFFRMQPVEVDGSLYEWRYNFFGVVKSPDEEVCNQAQLNYISNYVNRVNEAILRGDFDTFTSLCDLDSFVDYVLVNQLFLNNDMDFSLYMYKEAGGKLKLGPVWDFDQACGNSIKAGNGYEGWRVNEHISWVSALMEMPKFREHFLNKWIECYPTISAMPADIAAKAKHMEKAIARNYDRWQVIGQPYWRITEEAAAFTTYEQFLSRLTKWFENRIAWIDKQLGFE